MRDEPSKVKFQHEKETSMLIDAVYDNGNILFSKPFSFVHNRFNIKVEVPEIEIVSNVTSVKTPKKMNLTDSETLRAELKAIYRAAILESDARDDQLTEKQYARWESVQLSTTFKEVEVL